MKQFTSVLCVSSLLIGLAACSSDDPHAPPAKAELPADSSHDLQSALDGVVAAGVAPGVSIAVAHPSYRPWVGASGVADITTKVPLTPAARFRAGSMLKTAIATAVLQLVEHGELSLDDTIVTLLPGDVSSRIPNAEGITLRMLLGHRSGIPDFDDAAFDAEVAKDPKRVWSFDELLGRAVAQAPLFTPGARYAYTNTGYVLIGKLLEAKTGQPWRATVRDQVFARAGLAHTDLPSEGNALCDGCSRGYLPSDGQLLDITEIDPSMAGPAGGDALITTPADLATFVGALASGSLFDDPKTLGTMLEFADAAVPEEAQTAYGLGIARFHVGDVDLYGHLGGTAGFQGFYFFQPGTRVVASGYMNANGDPGAFMGPVLEAIARIH